MGDLTPYSVPRAISPGFSTRTSAAGEHEDNANTIGRAAGRAMAEAPVSYDHLAGSSTPISSLSAMP